MEEAPDDQYVESEKETSPEAKPAPRRAKEIQEAEEAAEAEPAETPVGAG